MITPGQLRAARVLLGLTQDALAARAGMAPGTVNGAEAGSKATRQLTFKVLEDVLAQAGVEFLAEDGEFGPGVRLRAQPALERRDGAG